MKPETYIQGALVVGLLYVGITNWNNTQDGTQMVDSTSAKGLVIAGSALALWMFFANYKDIKNNFKIKA